MSRVPTKTKGDRLAAEDDEGVRGPTGHLGGLRPDAQATRGFERVESVSRYGACGDDDQRRGGVREASTRPQYQVLRFDEFFAD